MQNKDEYIEIRWHVSDVLEVNPDLTYKEALQVLHHIKDNHDASIGVNWEVIEVTIQQLFNVTYEG